MIKAATTENRTRFRPSRVNKTFYIPECRHGIKSYQPTTAKLRCRLLKTHPTFILRPIVLMTSCFNVPCQLTPLHNLRFLTLTLTPFG